MSVKIIEQDSSGSREFNHARYSNGGAVVAIAFWFLLGVAVGHWVIQ